MNGRSLQYQTTGDVYMLLKSSDFLLRDLLHLWKGLADDPNPEDDELINNPPLLVENEDPHDNSPRPRQSQN